MRKIDKKKRVKPTQGDKYWVFCKLKTYCYGCNITLLFSLKKKEKKKHYSTFVELKFFRFSSHGFQ